MNSLAGRTREMLTREGLAPRKRLGQNFLIDRGVIDRMVALADLRPDEPVLEIGPGLGALTDVLATRTAPLYLIEFDRGLCTVLRRKYADQPHVHVVEGDVLKIDLREAAPEPRMRVVSSLPYNIAVPILFRLIEDRSRIDDVTVLLQREIAARLVAKPGTRAYGVPSLLFQLYAELHSRFRVSASAFYPRPQVTSEAIRVRFQPEPRVAVRDPTLFTHLVRAAFNQRRKMLRNALLNRPAPVDLTPEALERIFTSSGIDGRARGETLDLTAFAALSDATGRELGVVEPDR